MSISPRRLRTSLGQFATGVTVVSCRIDEGVHGATVNAFTAVSLDPPLVQVCLNRRSKMCAYLEGRPFAVTVLGSDAHETAVHFAGHPNPEMHIAWIEGHTAPMISGGVAAFLCSPWASYDGGDHVLHVGEVQEIAEGSDSAPLLFHGGVFRRIGSPLDGAA